MDAAKELTIEVWRQPDGKFKAFLRDEVANSTNDDEGFFPISTVEGTPMNFDTMMGVIEAEVGFALYGIKED